ncbi:MAG: hypothetical protein IPM32_02375 [Ignavibacteriae bacterium]|nr:hypothetical protein [Ignavibacteriota bacterium]
MELQLLSLKECANRMGVSRQSAWLYVMFNRLEAKKVGKMYVVEENKLNDFINNKEAKKNIT